MSLLAGLSLLAIMVTLAALPSTSVALVVTRSATAGFWNGAAVAAGIVMGDLVFVVLAILGMGALAETMGALAETMGAFFAVLKVAGGLYLIWMGIGLIRAGAKPTPPTSLEMRRSTLAASAAAGLFVTLGDVKAILFYASLFPTFVDMRQLSTGDVAWIVATTVIAVGGVKLIYAYLARRIVATFGTHPAARPAKIAAGTGLAGAGLYLIVKA